MPVSSSSGGVEGATAPPSWWGLTEPHPNTNSDQTNTRSHYDLSLITGSNETDTNFLKRLAPPPSLRNRWSWNHNPARFHPPRTDEGEPGEQSAPRQRIR